jgi:polysaccharide deacetylase family protein (PEP-CTERM system associated)
MNNIFTVDVEDWYHILALDSTPTLHEWESCEQRIEKNFERMLDIFDECGIKATCFFLGWIAEKYPHLVKLAFSRNHEIASHGFAHQLIGAQTERQFYDDVTTARKMLEDIVGSAVLGYRAPGFSITPKTRWALDALTNAGYKYDSSLFPARRGHGYFLNVPSAPFKLSGVEFFEFPISVVNAADASVCFFGGGYLRLFPYFVIKEMAKKVQREGRPVIYYVHPREIDPGQPRLKMNFFRAFKSYINLQTTERKIRKIASDGRLTTIREFLSQNINSMPEFEVSSLSIIK